METNYADDVSEKTWLGQRLHTSTIQLNQAVNFVPEFERMHFGDGANKNEYLDMIARLPFNGDKRTIPVATVSRRYALVQHKEVIRWLKQGLEEKI